jgi:hypothetical protein
MVDKRQNCHFTAGEIPKHKTDIQITNQIKSKSFFSVSFNFDE